MAAPLTYEQASILVGVTVRRLYQLVRDQEAPQPVDAKFPLAEFARWLDERKRGDSFQAERTRLTKAQADKTELEVAEFSGELVRADEVATAWGEKYAAARSRLLSWASKVATRVAPPGKVADVQALAQETVYEALNELAGDGLPERTRARRQAHEGHLEAAAAPVGKRVGGSAPDAVPRVKRRARKVADGDG